MKKTEKQKVLDELEKLRQKMFVDHQNWAALYLKSGAKEYLTKYNDEYWTSAEIISGQMSLYDIEYHIDYIRHHIEKGVKND